MSFLWDNLAAIYVALFASVIAWLFGGMRGDILMPVMPWLLAFLVEIILFFPQREKGEFTFAARTRVWKAMKKDPLVWIILLLLAILAVPFANTGLCPYCDAKVIATGVSAKPPVPFIPFCVNAPDHLSVFYWFAAALLSVIAVRHSLTRHGKRLALSMIVWNGVALAAFGFLESATGARGPFWIPLVSEWGTDVFFFSTFGYPNMAGDYFTLLFGLSVALWRFRREEVERDLAEDHQHAEKKKRGLFWKKNSPLIASVILYFAALNTLSRAAIMLATASAMVFVLHAAVSFLARMSRLRRLKSGVWGAIAIGLILFAATTFSPDKIQKEVDSIDTIGVLDRLSGKNEKYTKVAMAIWRDNLAFGCGGWGYSHLATIKARELGLDVKGALGGANVHNDYLQMLTEHGLVGFGLLLLIAAWLLAPIAAAWRALAKAARFQQGKNRPPRPVQIFALPASVFCVLTALTMTLIHAFADCPFRSAAVFVLFFVALTAADGFFTQVPTLKKETKSHASRK